MPINYRNYPSDWKERVAIIKYVRALNRCEWCGISNGVPLPSGRNGNVVLTIAHLGVSYPDGKPGNKHDKMDCRIENLACLCNRCHLRFDLPDHVQHAKETRARKKKEQAERVGQMSFFEER